jgi:hypothetical protein
MLCEEVYEFIPKYAPPDQFRFLYTQLEDHDGLEGFYFAFEGEQLFALSLLIEANHSLFHGDNNVCIIHCCTAIESCIFPILGGYLKGLLFNKGETNVNSILKELPMSIKYELIFGSVEQKLFEDEGQLLARLKHNNKIRNNIIHSGYVANSDEAYECLNDSSKFIGMIYLQMKDFSFEE